MKFIEPEDGQEIKNGGGGHDIAGMQMRSEVPDVLGAVGAGQSERVLLQVQGLRPDGS